MALKTFMSTPWRSCGRRKNRTSARVVPQLSQIARLLIVTVCLCALPSDSDSSSSIRFSQRRHLSEAAAESADGTRLLFSEAAAESEDGTRLLLAERAAESIDVADDGNGRTRPESGAAFCGAVGAERGGDGGGDGVSGSMMESSRVENEADGFGSREREAATDSSVEEEEAKVDGSGVSGSLRSLKSSGGRVQEEEECAHNLQRSNCSVVEKGRGEDSMVLLLNGLVYTPTPIGKRHILLAGSSIVSIFTDEEFSWENLVGLPVTVTDIEGSVVVPGLIDIHVHITGGGGEMGPASRTPEAGLSELVEGGLTTLIGVLGTDGVSRSLENLRVKAASLRKEGLTAFMWSGCYRVPSPTITGTIVSDLILIDEVVGAGEIAISDHRCSWASSNELVKLVSDARVGGMLSGKAGLVYFHMGDAPSMLDPLWELMNISQGAIPITQMLPTHISRTPALLEAAEIWIREGGLVDLTSDQEDENETFNALINWASKGSVALEQVSISSDGFGSLPRFDSKGKLIGYGIASPIANLNMIRRLVLEAGWTLEQALPLSTTNPAKFLSLERKGRVKVGSDGDVVVLGSQELEVQYVFAKGQLMKSPTWTKKGLFET